MGMRGMASSTSAGIGPARLFLVAFVVLCLDGSSVCHCRFHDFAKSFLPRRFLRSYLEHVAEIRFSFNSCAFVDQ